MKLIDATTTYIIVNHFSTFSISFKVSVELQRNKKTKNPIRCNVAIKLISIS